MSNTIVDTVPVTIVGGGAVGLAIAYELSRRQNGVVVLEKHQNLGEEQSGRNSGVIHAGIYYDKGSLKANHCVNGNRLIYEFCARYDVPAARVGKLVVAVNEKEDGTLEGLLQRATDNGVEGLRYLKGREVTGIEPNVTAYSALFFPSTGIVDAAGLVKKLAGLAVQQGAAILKGRKVIGIEEDQGKFKVTVQTRDGIESFLTEFLINSAGLYSDEIARMVNPENDYRIVPGRGEYCTFNRLKKPELNVQTNIYPIPYERVVDGISYLAPGIHLTPTFGLDGKIDVEIGSIINVGPAAQTVTIKDDYETHRYPVELFYDKIRPFFPHINHGDLQLGYTGIWADLQGHKDFVITKDKKYDNCLHLLGLTSPALTSSLSIGKYVKSIV